MQCFSSIDTKLSAIFWSIPWCHIYTSEKFNRLGDNYGTVKFGCNLTVILVATYVIQGGILIDLYTYHLLLLPWHLWEEEKSRTPFDTENKCKHLFTTLANCPRSTLCQEGSADSWDGWFLTTVNTFFCNSKFDIRSASNARSSFLSTHQETY